MKITPFYQGWKRIDKNGKFENLKDFCSCLATVVLVQLATVDSDFSMLNYNKNGYRMTLLTDLSLERMLCSKQYKVAASSRKGL